MLINNKDIAEFNTKLEKKQIGTALLEVKQEWVDKALRPLIFSKHNKYVPLQIMLVTFGNSRQDMEQNISNIIKAMEQCTIKFKDIDYYFDVFLTSANIEYIGETDNEEYVSSVLIELMSMYKHKGELTHIANRVTSTSINYSGNIESLVTIEISPMAQIVDFRIDGLSEDPIIIKNVSGKLIINGEDGTVLMNGINKFKDTNMWEFPKLKPGANSITFNRNSCDVKIKYKENWI